MKGRKGKKGNKAGMKNANTATLPQQANAKSRYESQPVDRTSTQQQSTQSEELQGEDHDDDTKPLTALPTPNPSKIPLPVARGYKQTFRSNMSTKTVNKDGEAG